MTRRFAGRIDGATTDASAAPPGIPCAVARHPSITALPAALVPFEIVLRHRTGVLSREIETTEGHRDEAPGTSVGKANLPPFRTTIVGSGTAVAVVAALRRRGPRIGTRRSSTGPLR